MYYTVDRIEESVAVLEHESGGTRNVKLADLPENIKEGDILSFDGACYIIDAGRTWQAKKDIEGRFNKLFLN